MKSYIKMYPERDNINLEMELGTAQEEFDELVKKHGELKTKKELDKEASNHGATDKLS